MRTRSSKFVIFFLLVIFFQTNSLCFLQQNKNSKNILVIFTLGSDNHASKLILENLKNTLLNNYNNPYHLYVEYLDITRFPDLAYLKYVFDRLNEKYKAIKIDILVATGPKLIPLLDSYALENIKDAPTISIDFKYQNDHNIKYSLNPLTKEILVNFYPEKTIELAVSLFPDNKLLYIVTGSGNVDKYIGYLTTEAAAKFKKTITSITISDLSMEEILKRMKNIPSKSTIFLTSITSDVNNIPYNTLEAVRLIKAETEQPIFVLFDTPFGGGALGGYVLSFKNVGIEAGNAVIKILNGENPKSVIIDKEKFNHYMFDWTELKKWNLQNSDLIPEGSTIEFEETDFITRYKWLLLAGISFLILQTLLIINLFRLYRRQKLTTKRLIETENRYRELVREDRVLRMGELTASLSHELNQPLTAILSTAQAGIRFINSDKSSPELLKEIFQNIVEDDKRAAEIISSVRSFMKVEAREKEKVELNSIIQDVIVIFRSEAIRQSIKISTETTKNQIFIFADKIQIQQVMLNFIFNAAHSMEKTEVENKRIIIKESLADNKVIVSVRDFGTGISSEIKEKLFIPFVTTKQKGFGIGLAVCKSIIENHQGKIWADNNADGGATFSFELKFWGNEK